MLPYEASYRRFQPSLLMTYNYCGRFSRAYPINLTNRHLNDTNRYLEHSIRGGRDFCCWNVTQFWKVVKRNKAGRGKFIHWGVGENLVLDTLGTEVSENFIYFNSCMTKKHLSISLSLKYKI